MNTLPDIVCPICRGLFKSEVNNTLYSDPIDIARHYQWHKLENLTDIVKKENKDD